VHAKEIPRTTMTWQSQQNMKALKWNLAPSRGFAGRRRLVRAGTGLVTTGNHG
jgi:hypothetical protein